MAGTSSNRFLASVSCLLSLISGMLGFRSNSWAGHMKFSGDLAGTLFAAVSIAALGSCSNATQGTTYVGYVEADWVYIAAPRSGLIDSRPADEGMKVSAGDVLFTLDADSQLAATSEADSRVSQALAQSRDIATGAREPEIRALEAELAVAKVELGLARTERDRVSKLVGEGIASRQQGDEADAAYRTAEARETRAREQIRVARQAGRPGSRQAANANVKAARAASDAAKYELEQRTVRAPENGSIEEAFHEPGEFVAAGNPVVALLPMDGLKVRFFVSQETLPSYKIGTKVSVRADGLEKAVEGKVSYIASEAEFTPPVIYSKDARKKLVFLVEADVPTNSGLRAGIPVDVTGP